ncbi:MAG TPA: exo-alpha-sialidase [Blastocatellia bacterium]|nr:exo-alpha-sialidase [Blastocatellia bacterium]
MPNHFLPRTTALIALILLTATAIAQETPAQKYLVSVERIWERAPHSAFTDLVEFNGKLYCTFREGSGHVPGKEGTNGTVRIIASDDGQNWRSVALLAEEHVDLRDPKLSVTPDGRLMLLIGGSYYKGEVLGVRHTRVSFSDKAGTLFSVPKPIVVEAKIKTEADWLWRVTWYRGVGYGVIYQSGGDEFKAQLVATRDGLHYQHVTTFDIAGRPNETTLRFNADGEMIAWVRRERGTQQGFIGTSRAPYKEWTWKEQNARLGGPNFVVLPNGKLIGATRWHLPEGKTRTSVVWLKQDGTLEPIVMLPSAGDNSYAGMILRGDQLFVSYYASHEGKTAIYLAVLRRQALLRE